jgi:hypothetical protein
VDHMYKKFPGKYKIIPWCLWFACRSTYLKIIDKTTGARHNERAWSNRIHEPLLHLYGKQNKWHWV